jgi:hypothetical protein
METLAGGGSGGGGGSGSGIECRSALGVGSVPEFDVRRYLVSTLGFPETSVTLAFSATSVTSPILGVLIGGQVRCATHQT